MYPITNAVKALFEAEQRKVLRITGTDKNGEPIILTDETIMQNGFSIDRFACTGDRLEIGTAVSAELTLKLNNANGDFDDIVFEGAELFVEIGIADWGQTNPTISYIPCGYFTPDVQPRSLTIVTLNALDRMMRFDQVAETSSTPWTTNLGANVTDNNGNIIYFVEGFSLPCNVATLVRQICDTCNVPFEQDLSNLPNYNYVVSALPTTNEDITYRSILQWCAGLMGTNAWIDWEGKLRFSWYNNTTDYSSTTATRYSSDLYEDAIEITGVQFVDTDEDKTVYLAGTNAYVLDMSNNGLVNSANAATILAAIYNVVHNFAYTPFTASVVAAPYLWPMDRVTFTDKHDVGHVSSLTNVNIVLNGGTVLKSAGETAQTAKGTSPGYFTSSQQRELEHIVGVTNTAMQDAVDHATEMITGGLGGYVILGVDELTGQTQEILIMDNPDKNLAVNVWRFNQGGLGHSSNGYSGPFNDIALTADGQINANMITTGTLNANLITTGTITDFSGNNYWNLNTGEIRMTSGSIDIGDFEVDSTGALTCTGATINGSFTVDYIPVDPSQASEIGQNTYKITLGDRGFDFYANNVLSGRISEDVWVEAGTGGSVVHDDGVEFLDVRGNGMTVGSTGSQANFKGNNANISASGTMSLSSSGKMSLSTDSSYDLELKTTLSGDIILDSADDVEIKSADDMTIESTGSDVYIKSPYNSIYLDSVALYVKKENVDTYWNTVYSGEGYCDGQWFVFRNGLLIRHAYGGWTDL